MKIGIELNNVVRNINKQIVKYYKKDINRGFDDEKVDLNVVDIMNYLEFPSKKAQRVFLFEDYPFEVYGSAPQMDKDLSVKINRFLVELADEENPAKLSFFSLKEKGLSIQSSYFFLSKIGSRIRETFFPKNASEVWDNYDIVITTSEEIVKSKPEGKRVILVEKSDNKDAIAYADMVIHSLDELFHDKGWVEIGEKQEHEAQTTWINRLKNKFFK